MAGNDDWIYVGRIVGAFGVSGEVKVQADTDFPSRFDPGKALFAGPEHEPLVVRARRRHRQLFLLSFEGRPNRNAIEPLCGLPLYALGDEALPEDVYRVRDLLGCEVVTAEGRALGTLREVLPTGANDVYIVQGEHGEVLLPAIEDVVRSIDVEGKRIVVTPLPGLLPGT